MCGIAGFFNAREDYAREKGKWQRILSRMNQAQKHRGPDGSGTYVRPNVGFAHVRLKIIDLLTGERKGRRLRRAATPRSSWPGICSMALGS